MKRLIAPLAVGMVMLYAALAIGAANCLVLHVEQPPAHHHSHSHVAHSALCAWACQINPTVIVSTPVPLVAISTVVARLSFADSAACTAFLCSPFSSRAPPLA
jgi:hypothetical protein